MYRSHHYNNTETHTHRWLSLTLFSPLPLYMIYTREKLELYSCQGDKPLYPIWRAAVQQLSFSSTLLTGSGARPRVDYYYCDSPATAAAAGPLFRRQRERERESVRQREQALTPTRSRLARIFTNFLLFLSRVCVEAFYLHFSPARAVSSECIGRMMTTTTMGGFI